MHESILVVEDEELVAMDIHHALFDRGYSVATASSGEEAIARARQVSPDLIIMDIKLDGIDGIETARRIQSTMDVAVVYLTAYSDSATLERARKSAPYGYLVKPFDTNELYATVAMTLERHAIDRDRKQRARISVFLAGASARLVQSRDYESVLASAAELLVPHYADSCLIRLLPIGELVPSLALVQPGEIRIADPGSLVASVLRGGAPRIEAVSDPRDLSHVLGEEHARALADRGIVPRSFACLPLRNRRQLLGALLVVSGEPDVYAGETLVFVEDFVHRFAMAVDSALLYLASAEASRQRDDLLAIISHDLFGRLQVMLEQAETLAPASEQARRIVSGVQGMQRLLQDLVDAASIAVGRLSIVRAPHSAGEIVAEAIERSRQLAAEKSIELRGKTGAELTEVSCDRHRIVQALSNMIDNATERTPPGGSITVRLHRDGACARFEITDTGPAIPPEELAHPFERLVYAGGTIRTGLGPYLARGIVELHYGTIATTSVPGSGTTVWFTLPGAAIAERR